MKNIVVNNAMNFISKYKNLDDITGEEIRYGLASIYLTFSKLIVISIIAAIIGIFKQMISLLIIYNILRSTSFGLHASKSWMCLLFSTIIFIGGTLLCMNIELNKNIVLVIGFVTIILIYLYSPADTKKRPIVNPTRRKVYKYISTVIATTYLIISLAIYDTFIINCLVLSLIIQSIVINPLTYKICNMSYNNYKSYNMN